jgi:hypothetical protein
MSSEAIDREVRRIVTGHNAEGKAVIAADEQIQAADWPRTPAGPTPSSSPSGPRTRCRSI